MPGGHPNARHEADTRADPIIARMIELGYLGSGEPFDIPMQDHDSANEGRLSVNRSARRQNLSPGAWVADQHGERCYKDCADPGAPHYLRVKLWPKDAARSHIFRESGGDPAKLKYNPWQRKTPRYSDQGQLPG
jgi:hypothetical protein